jgi:hypothetical protein
MDGINGRTNGLHKWTALIDGINGRHLWMALSDGINDSINGRH